jgi:cell division protein FtsB
MFFYRDVMFKSSVVLLFILFFITIFSHNGIIDYYRLSKEKQLIMADIKKIEEKNSNFSFQIKRLTNDQEYIEHVAKHEFGMAAADEYVFKTISNRKTSTNSKVAKP